MTELDYGQALVFLEKAIGEKGADYVYEVNGLNAKVEADRGNSLQCLYFDKGQPSCIVGHVLDYMGIGANEAIENEPARNALDGLIETDEKTITLLDKVQEHQDKGVPWGEALRLAQFGDDE